MKRYSASLLDSAGTRYVELRVRTKATWGSDASTVTVRSRVRTEGSHSTSVALHLRADAMRSIPTGSVTAQLTPSLHEVTFTVEPSGEWSTSAFDVTRSRGEKRIVTHALLAGRAMTSTTVNRKVYVSVSTMVAMLLLLIGSLAVSKSAGDSPVFADPISLAPLQSTDSTSAVTATTNKTPTSSPASKKFSVLPAKAEFPAMEPRTEDELLAGVPDDGKTWIVIPRLHLRMQIVSGISDDRLALGVGWYRRGPKLGSNGNIGLAGHRTTYPAPFFFLDKMRVADSVILIVGNEIHQYLVRANEVGEPYDVVQPDNIGVLAYLGYDSVTLTTCTPIGTTNERLIVHAKLMKRSPFERRN